MPEQIENTPENFKPIDVDSLDDSFDIMLQNEVQEEQSFIDDFVTDGPTIPSADDAGLGLDTQPDVEAEALEGEAEASTDGTEEEEVELTGELLDQSVADAEKEELEILNKRFNTDYKSLEEFNARLKSEEGPNEQVAKVEKMESAIAQFDKYLQYDDKDLVYQDIRAIKANQGVDVNDPEIAESIKDEVDSMTATQLSYAARTVKAEISAVKAKYEAETTSYRETTKKTAQQLEAERKEALISKAQKVYQSDNFYGLKLSKEQVISGYKASRSDKNIISQVKKDPASLLELQLLWENREEIAKVMGGATFSDGVDATLGALRGEQPKLAKTVGNNKLPSSGLPDHIAGWLK